MADVGENVEEEVETRVLRIRRYENLLEDESKFFKITKKGFTVQISYMLRTALGV